jgi:metal-dependent amidase/aminoacylase/carboxypeptidase family protein
MGACKRGIQNARHIAIPMECNCKWNQKVSTLFCPAWENESVDIVGNGICVKCVDVFYRSHADGGDVTFYKTKSNKKLLLIQHPRGRYNKAFRVLRLAS